MTHIPGSNHLFSLCSLWHKRTEWYIEKTEWYRWNTILYLFANAMIIFDFDPYLFCSILFGVIGRFAHWSTKPYYKINKIFHTEGHNEIEKYPICFSFCRPFVASVTAFVKAKERIHMFLYCILQTWILCIIYYSEFENVS